jgi:polyphenol oxidase
VTDHVPHGVSSERPAGLDLRVGGARVRFTTCADGDLGLTEPAPPDSTVLGNRARVLEGCGLEAIAAGHQVHGVRVAVVDRARPGYVVSETPADGQATSLRRLGVAIHAADCLPIAVAGDGGVAMLHGGWRGLAGGVIAAGVDALRELGVDGPLEAAIGPGAGGCCYETGPEVSAAFGGRDAPGEGRCVDLKEVARRQLAAAGVEWVEDVGICTLCAASGLVFSHRRDGPVTGRHAGIAWLE